KNNGRLLFAYDAVCLHEPMHHFKWIFEIFPVKITSELARGDRKVPHPRLSSDQLAFNSVDRTDVINLPAEFMQRWNQSQIHHDMPGCAAASQYNFFVQQGHFLSLLPRDSISFYKKFHLLL